MSNETDPQYRYNINRTSRWAALKSASCCLRNFLVHLRDGESDRGQVSEIDRKYSRYNFSVKHETRDGAETLQEWSLIGARRNDVSVSAEIKLLSELNRFRLPD